MVDLTSPDPKFVKRKSAAKDLTKIKVQGAQLHQFASEVQFLIGEYNG